MFVWPLVFLLAAAISGVFGFGLFGYVPSGLSKFAFFGSAVLLAGSLVFAFLRRIDERGIDEDEDAQLNDKELPTDET